MRGAESSDLKCNVDITPALYPPSVSKFAGRVLHHCWPAALLAALGVLLVVSGGGGALLAAAGGI